MARIAFVLEADFEDAEFQEPYDQLQAEGHDCVVIGTEAGKELQGKRENVTVTVDTTIDAVDFNDFDALVIPGGYAPDKLRLHEGVVEFTRKFVESDKPVAAICHAGQLLIETGAVKGRTVTSWPSVTTDLQNAGATWVDEEVVVDGNLISSRGPDDIPAFVTTLKEHLQRSRG